MMKINKFLSNPLNVFETLGHRGFFNWMDDESYLKILYKIRVHKKLSINNPSTFNEKIQWLKLFNRNPIYTKMVDKYEAKMFVKKVIGNKYVIPTLGLWEHFSDIDFSGLPNKFVLKCTHDSGGIIICKDKRNLNFTKAKIKLENCLSHNYYWGQREWPYKNIRPRILAEAYMSDNILSTKHNEALTDYKLMCFNGTVKCSFTCTDRYSDSGLCVTFFDREWKKLPFERQYPASNKNIVMPKNYEKMIILAEKLAVGIPFVRVDFYEVNGKIYFGELTFFPGSGFEIFRPEDWDKILGEWLILPKKY